MTKRHSMLFALCFSALVAACALILAGTPSFAASVANESNSASPPNPAAMLQTQFDKVQASLSLTDAQTTLWNEAETYTLAQMKEDFERMNTTRAKIKASLSDSSPDMHALATSLEDDMDAHVSAAKKNHELWLAVYDSLDTDQQATLRKAFVKELTKMEKMRRMGPPPGGAAPAASRSSM